MKLNLLSLFILACSISTVAYPATFDDFNDGNDDGWQRYNPTDGVFSFPVESKSGAYKMETSPGWLLSPGRIMSINLQEPAQSQFHVEVDLLNWTYNWGEDIGIVARVQEPLPSFFLPAGYALLLRNDRDGRPASRKLMIVKSSGGMSFPYFMNKSGALLPPPDPSGDYRLKFWSGDGGFWGQIIDKSTGQPIKMWNGTNYVDRIYAAEDGEFSSGRTGLVAYVHIVGYRAEGVSPVFDNFYSGTEPPVLINGIPDIAPVDPLNHPEN